MPSRLLKISRKAVKFPGAKVDPGILFDAAWYVENNDVTVAPSKAWAHFCSVGWKLGANPCAAFDTSWYAAAYPDVAVATINPLLHYITEGYKKGYFPHPLFDTRFYCENNPDVVLEGTNPLAHYLEHGFKEGRQPIDLFDDYWYLAHYKDVARARTLPIYHYAKYGAFENRNPSLLFDTAYYKKHNGDVPYHAINPLNHYIRHGRAEGRKSKSLQRDIYSEWIDRNERSGPVSRRDARFTLKLFRYFPKLSIVVPTYNTPLRYLSEFISSVKHQIYPFWELCIADDASPEPHVRAELAKYESDPRIKITYLETNLHIAGATNAAMKLATGDFICLMDHDDLISEDALYEFALKLNLHPDLDMIYSDEDKLSLSGERYEPFFKPDWSPEYLEGCMYTAHFACYRKSIVDQIGGFRRECNGAQDYDFVLRFVQQTQKIGHIAKILYHWRAIPGSTAQSMDNKDYVIDAAVRALSDYLEREGTEGTVKTGIYSGSFDLVRAVKGEPKVSIIIPTAGRPATIRGQTVDLLSNCVESIARSTYKNFEIIAIHNGDLSEETLQRIEPHGVLLVEYRASFNVARKMNLGAAAANGSLLLFLNDDIEVITPEWLEAMIGLAQKPGIGCVGAKLFFENGAIQHIGVTFAEGMPDHVLRNAPQNDPGYFFSSVTTKNWQAATGACLMCSQETFKAVGGFEEAFAINYNDIDLCLKIGALGLRCVATPHARLYHFESQNRARSVDDKEIDLFARRWPQMNGVDPFYSINFDCRPPDFKMILEQPGVEEYDGSDLLNLRRLDNADEDDKKAKSMLARLLQPWKPWKASGLTTAGKNALVE